MFFANWFDACRPSVYLGPMLLPLEVLMATVLPACAATFAYLSYAAELILSARLRTERGNSALCLVSCNHNAVIIIVNDYGSVISIITQPDS